ncbi:unnamed protein product [Staurois parvus]|uniref:Uncharacterized protein n=1 Tax=Staurois parvus TaxID=386267 RepID=A0ABN9E0A3_9NEOB|nr:unnamed protein product [Staurois parvus]
MLHIAQCSQASTALGSSSSMLYTTASDACFALGDIRLGCSYWAMETHSMKLSKHCCCANLEATHNLEVFSY